MDRVRGKTRTEIPDGSVGYHIGAVAVLIENGLLDTPCHVWQGCVNGSGHPLRGVDRRRLLGHRFAYEQVKGPIPAGYEIHHICKNARCLNPDHLELHTLLTHRAQHRTFDYEEAASLRRQGWSYREIGRAVGASRGAVQRAISRMAERGAAAR
jgi:hypothetical protein